MNIKRVCVHPTVRFHLAAGYGEPQISLCFSLTKELTCSCLFQLPHLA